MDTIILAGGKSRRMGQNKALLPLGNERVIDRLINEFSPISRKMLLVTNHPSEFQSIHINKVTDEPEFKGHGPLAGLEIGLKSSTSQECLIIACDMPFASRQVGKWLVDGLINSGYDAVIPMFEGRIHPLFGAYQKGIQSIIRTCLLDQKRRMTDLINQLNVKLVEQNDAPDYLQKVWEKCFWNMNTMDDYQKALKHLGGQNEF
ncbi:molybdenum cofactor guanylyltransferase [Heyndrickxia vini]|uniref:Probable molybdenum cofactor guanylyltransferase n=1 Tax=Heyndrickxia vini TaxID=1476025 RepID=A0ABX7E0J3_9BACI|nr:molybdenum cofactor guanylyltransferase [Heyndrickxia vini]QQZ09263.1 molybdenum cofactor guanylyltransferase [Heyndrickxia vini]